jgi:hypothetical protein
VDVDAEYRPLVACTVPASHVRHLPSGTSAAPTRFPFIKHGEGTMGRGILLWLLGVPIPVIILLWLFFGH